MASGVCSLGLTMQVLLIAAQNSVPYSELGVDTSLATFSRSIGGSIGVSLFGAIFAAGLAAERLSVEAQVREMKSLFERVIRA